MSRSSSKSSRLKSNGWGYAIDEASWPLRLTDIGFALLIVVLPLIWGGRQALGHLAAISIAGWISFWWAVHQVREDRPKLRFSGAEPLLLMAAALVVIQTLTVPESIRNSLSPQIAELLPNWTATPGTGLGVGTWSTLSFAPWQSSSDLITVVSLMAVFFVGIQRIETVHDVQRLIRCVAVSGCVMAAFGITQYFTGQGLFYWFYEHPNTTTASTAKGAFTNSNHFASFLSMALPAQLWWYIIDTRQMRKLRDANSFQHAAPTGLRAVLIEWGPIVAMLITVSGIVLSQSRGGLLVSAIGMVVACGLFWRQRLLDTRVTMLVAGTGLMGMMIVMAFGQRLEAELAENAEAIREGVAKTIDQGHSRQKIWATAFKVIEKYPLVGTGLGTHSLAYSSYHDYSEDHTEFTHAENGYLQVAFETGVTGLAIVTLLIGLIGYWCVRGLWIATTTEARAAFVVVIAGLAVNLAHSFTDFVWYVPGCMAVVVLLAASASGLHRLSLPKLPVAPLERPEVGRVAWGAMLLLIVMGVGWGTRFKWPEVLAEPHYMAFRRISRESPSAEDHQQFVKLQHDHIMQAALANPHDPTLLALAARSNRRMFILDYAKSHDMAIEEVQMAASSSSYPSKKELHAWLDIPEVLGAENRQYLQRAQSLALRSLRHCPLPSLPYLEIAQTAWINLAPQEVADRYFQQALIAQPYSSVAMTRYADSLMLRGEGEAAHRLYVDAYTRDDRCRAEIIRNLSKLFPVKLFLTQFPLDRDSLTELRVAYKATEDREGYVEVLRKLADEELAAALYTSGETSAAHVVTAHGCYFEAGDIPQAIDVLRKSVRRHSSSFTLRFNLGSSLLTQGEYAEALPHLEWCLHRKPDDATVRQRVELAIQGRSSGTMMAEESIDSLIR